ncbi:uncharacterized protein BYT42DRAFT_570981 [Radiomyces spectabilis]|uniref:uncharacterized protein n=1 Tax=Radiomyces spectabilis TaxID=64574 RepID=UPI00221EA7FA|nr:uncharacterized protein BYT42DRAFT_570981 [Radiomyces spectabilis]KAI8377616.1 hypothetical protein BYT42DRAFT_570981 [Radiomyces spectabilis]
MFTGKPAAFNIFCYIVILTCSFFFPISFVQSDFSLVASPFFYWSFEHRFFL